MNADADLKRMWYLRILEGRPTESGNDFDPGAYGPLGIVFMRHGIAKVHQQAIPYMQNTPRFG